MDYVFGVLEGKETLTTKGGVHSSLTGICEVERQYHDRVITDHFRVVERQFSGEDSEGNCYDRYVIDSHYRMMDKSKGLQETIGTAAQAAQEVAALTFVVLAESGSIDDVTAGEHADLFVEWSGNGIQYEVGQLRRYEGKLYRCVQAHKSQPDWTPATVASLWAAAADPAEEWPEWSQPQGAHDAYPLGAKVTYKGKHYVNDIEANIYPPDTMNGGWHEAREGE